MLGTGIRLCPPASTLPSWPNSASTATVSSTVRGAWCTNGAGFTLAILPARRAWGKAPPRPRGRCPRAGRSVLPVAGRRLPVSGAPVAVGLAVARGAGVALLVEVIDAVAVAVDVVTHGDRGAVGPVAQLLRGDSPRQVVADDRDDGAERDALEREVLGDVDLDVADADDDAGRDRDEVDRVAEVDPVLLPDLRAEQADHAVEDDRDAAQHSTG